MPRATPELAELSERIASGDIKSLDMKVISHLLGQADPVQQSLLSSVLSLLRSGSSVISLDLWGALRPPPAGVPKEITSPLVALVEMLRWNPTLCVLDVGGNGLGDEACADIVDAVVGGGSRVMERIVLSQNELTDRSATAVARLISGMGCLQHLELKGNALGNAAATAIGAALCENRVLISLSLARNSISPKGAAELARGAEANNTLCNLDLKHNLLGKNTATQAQITARCRDNARRGTVANPPSLSSSHASSVQPTGLAHTPSSPFTSLPPGRSLAAAAIGGLSTMGTPLKSRRVNSDLLPPPPPPQSDEDGDQDENAEGARADQSRGKELGAKHDRKLLLSTRSSGSVKSRGSSTRQPRASAEAQVLLIDQRVRQPYTHHSKPPACSSPPPAQEHWVRAPVVGKDSCGGSAGTGEQSSVGPPLPRTVSSSAEHVAAWVKGQQLQQATVEAENAISQWTALQAEVHERQQKLSFEREQHRVRASALADRETRLQELSQKLEQVRRHRYMCSITSTM
eukprot:COSAG05_NODE_238_length_13155_cov_489.969899_2_plen_518_part_00